MKDYKRILRRILLIFLIIIASFGVGLAGGLPLPPANKREDKIEVEIEMVDEEENEVK